MERDTIATIAKRTGYSVSTVSRVIGGNAAKYRISPATVERIMTEIRKSNYTPNLLAKGLRTNKTHTIGLIIPDIENLFFAKIASVVMKEAHGFGYRVTLFDTQEDVQNEIDAMAVLSAQSVDGIIAAPCSQDVSFYDRTSTPLLFIDRYIPKLTRIPFVTTDNYAGAVLALEHLLENGHKNILCIQGNKLSMPNQDRVRGITDVVKSHKIEHSVTIKGEEFSIANGYLETKLALSSSKCPTAIFAMSGNILFGAIRAIKESGKRIPEDISIIAFDDNVVFNYLDPAITCVRQPSDELGSLSVKLLMRAIQLGETSGKGSATVSEEPTENLSAPTEPSHLFLAPTLVVRKSVNRIASPVV